MNLFVGKMRDEKNVGCFFLGRTVPLTEVYVFSPSLFHQVFQTKMVLFVSCWDVALTEQRAFLSDSRSRCQHCNIVLIFIFLVLFVPFGGKNTKTF